MKIFGYMDDVIAWQMGLEWYWSWALAIGVIALVLLIWVGINLYFISKFRGQP